MSKHCSGKNVERLTTQSQCHRSTTFRSSQNIYAKSNKKTCSYSSPDEHRWEQALLGETKRRSCSRCSTCAFHVIALTEYHVTGRFSRDLSSPLADLYNISQTRHNNLSLPSAAQRCNNPSYRQQHHVICEFSFSAFRLVSFSRGLPPSTPSRRLS